MTKLFTTENGNKVSSQEIRNLLRKRDGDNCWLCGQYIVEGLWHGNPFQASIDHLLEVSNGGKNQIANLKLTHAICNNRRSNYNE